MIPTLPPRFGVAARLVGMLALAALLGGRPRTEAVAASAASASVPPGFV